MGAFYDDLPGHEGFGLRDEDNAAWVAACSCGWRDHQPHPVDEAGYEAAVDRWDAHHAAPLLEHAVPADVADFIEATRQAVADLARRRPRAAATAVDGLSRWCAVLRRTAGIEAGAPTVQERLDALVERSRRDGRRLGR